MFLNESGGPWLIVVDLDWKIIKIGYFQSRILTQDRLFSIKIVCLQSKSWTSLSIKIVYFPYIIHLPIPAILLIAAYVEVIITVRIGAYNNILTVFWVNCMIEWDFLVLWAFIWRQRHSICMTFFSSLSISLFLSVRRTWDRLRLEWWKMSVADTVPLTVTVRSVKSFKYKFQR